MGSVETASNVGPVVRRKGRRTEWHHRCSRNQRKSSRLASNPFPRLKQRGHLSSPAIIRIVLRLVLQRAWQSPTFFPPKDMLRTGLTRLCTKADDFKGANACVADTQRSNNPSLYIVSGNEGKSCLTS